MYVEIYLFDNFLMDLLVINLASAFIKTRPMKRKYVLCFLCALYALVAYFVPAMNCLLCKILLCALLAHSWSHKSVRAFFQAALCVMLSAMLLGGITYAIAFMAGRSIESNVLYAPIGVRVLIYGAGIACAMPCVIRKLNTIGALNKNTHRLTLSVNGTSYEYVAILDTGSSLSDPLSARPVVLVYAPELMKNADIQIPYRSAFSGGCVNALKPQKVFIDEIDVDVLIAPVDFDDKMPAIIPACAMPRIF